MKKIIIQILIMFLVSSCVFSPELDIVGEWQSKKTILSFDSDMTVEIIRFETNTYNWFYAGYYYVIVDDVIKYVEVISDEVLYFNGDRYTNNNN